MRTFLTFSCITFERLNLFVSQYLGTAFTFFTLAFHFDLTLIFGKVRMIDTTSVKRTATLCLSLSLSGEGVAASMYEFGPGGGARDGG